MSSHALARISQESAFRIQQKKEWGEIITGWETKNRYHVVDGQGQPVLLAGEIADGFGAVLIRAFLKNKRPFTIELRTPDGQLALTLVRPWTWFFSRLEVQGPNGEHLGTIQQRFKFFGRLLEVKAADGTVLAELQGPLFKPWTFLVSVQGREAGMIQKKWSGFGKELFTDADSFGVQFEGVHDARTRHLVLAATFLVDFVYFENSGK